MAILGSVGACLLFTLPFFISPIPRVTAFTKLTDSLVGMFKHLLIIERIFLLFLNLFFERSELCLLVLNRLLFLVELKPGNIKEIIVVVVQLSVLLMPLVSVVERPSVVSASEVAVHFYFACSARVENDPEVVGLVPSEGDLAALLLAGDDDSVVLRNSR